MSRTPGQRLIRVGLLLMAGAAVVALASCDLSGAPAAHPTPHTSPIVSFSPSPQMAMPPKVTSPLGPPPSNCPKATPIKTLTTANFGGGFSGTTTFEGDTPAWELGLDPNGAVAAQGTPYPSSKIMWVVGPNINLPVTLSGRDLRSGAPLWFDLYPSNLGGGTDTYTTSAVLDPAHPNRGSATNSLGHWNIWGIGVIVSAASCYQLTITSTAGAWHTGFAAGTIPSP